MTRFDYYVELLKECNTFYSACKVYAHILADEELTKEEKKKLDTIYEEHMAKMQYVVDA
jgi:hypothetical protein